MVLFWYLPNFVMFSLLFFNCVQSDIVKPKLKLTFHSEFKTWSDARQTCKKLNGELACLIKIDKDRIVLDTKGLFKLGENIKVWSLDLDCKKETPEAENAGVHIQEVFGTLQLLNAMFSSNDMLPFYCLVVDTGDTKVTTCCETIYARGLTWNATCDNKIVVQKCPGDTTGNAKWSCDITSAKWFPKTPDLSGCISKHVEELLNSLNSSDIPGTYNTLLNAASQSKAGGDVIAISDVLGNVTTSLVKSEGNYTNEEWLDVVENVTDSVADIMDSFLNDVEIWTDIPEEERVKTAETSMASFKSTGFALIQAMNDSELSNHTIAKDNVFLQAIKREKGWYTDKNLSFTLSDNSSTNRDVILTLPSGFENDLPSQDTQGEYTFVLFTTLWNMQDVLVVRGENSFKNRTENRAINSAILSINLFENETASIPLSNNVTFTVAHKNSSSKNPVCSYWDYNTKNWEVDGCWIVETNLTHTTCTCNHLTNFAITMDLANVFTKIWESSRKTSPVLTYVGTTVFIIVMAMYVYKKKGDFDFKCTA